MLILLPNSANLRNMENFIRKLDPSDTSRLEVAFHRKYVGVHPAVLSMTACAGAVVREKGGTIKCTPPLIHTMRYLTRMKVFDHLGVEPPEEVIEHGPGGRFIPGTRITTGEELDRFMIDITPLFHAQPEQAESVKYVVSELVRNALDIMYPPLVRRDREHDVVPLRELGLDGPLDDVRAIAAAEEEGVTALLDTCRVDHVALPDDLAAAHDRFLQGIGRPGPSLWRCCPISLFPT